MMAALKRTLNDKNKKNISLQVYMVKLNQTVDGCFISLHYAADMILLVLLEWSETVYAWFFS